MSAAEPNHADREHSEHGFSKLLRWWNCPGSVALVRDMPDTPSAAAQRGTAAHETAELCLRSGQDAVEYVGRTVAGIEVDARMAEAVQTYVDECRDLIASADWHDIEVRFNLAPLNPPAPMFGTADFVAYQADARRLRVRDYKNGWVFVDAQRNPQMLGYALGALIELGADKPVSEVEIGIVQPNSSGEAVRVDTIEAIELAEWSVELMERAAATLEPDAPLVPGEWCSKTYCPARATCPARRAQALAVAQAEFGAPPRDVRLMTEAEFAELPHRLPALKQWVADVESALIEYARRHGLPGWKLVHGDGRTAWIKPDDAAAALMAEHDFAEAEAFEKPKPVSPAQARDKLAARLKAEADAAGRKLTKKAATAEARARLAALTYTPPSSSGPQLVPDSDCRPAIGAPGADFANAPLPPPIED